MDGLALLVEAHAAGLTVMSDGDRLVIAGPRAAGPVAVRLLDAKPLVLVALTQKPTCKPLDEVISEDMALKHDRAEIENRVERLIARAALPGATPLDRVIAADWTAIQQCGRDPP
jgi:hypothetical protein